MPLKQRAACGQYGALDANGYLPELGVAGMRQPKQKAIRSMFFDECHAALGTVTRLVLHYFRVHWTGIFKGRGGGIGGLSRRRGRRGRLLAAGYIESSNGKQCDRSDHSEFHGYFHVFCLMVIIVLLFHTVV